ncbi:DUF2218 domain-containing protein [Egicoccus halophilus]|uniref:Uncharacterized protein n=1 Tax=Egicoccus halophilus TaxID=1670830 RepID=A0A8J3ERM7_9ACTN|nr:DUF2218 domain-containing protein [Egicoccus halophilus]GGI05290.1 hypothetical protein GCM10011354_13360 [Egicoccus halophilus]
MDPVELVRVSVRRWYVTVPLLALGVVAAVFILVNAERVHEVNGSVLLADRAVLDAEAGGDFGAARDETPPDGDVPEGDGTVADALDDDTVDDGTVDGALEGEDGDAAGAAANEQDEDEGISAGLLAEIINLDGRATTNPDEGSGASLRANGVSNTTLRIDVFSDDPAEAQALLEEKYVEAAQIIGEQRVLEQVVFPQEASPSSDGRGAFQSSALLRIRELDVGGGEPIASGYALQVVTELMLAAESYAAVEAATGGVEFDYTVAQLAADQAPLLDITVEAPSEEDAERVWVAVRDVADERLERLQQVHGVPQEQWLGFAELVRDPPQELTTSEGRRLAMIALGIFGLLALAAGLAVDGAARRRALADADEPVGDADEPVGDADEPVGDVDEPVGDADEPVGDADEPVGDVDEPVDERWDVDDPAVRTPSDDGPVEERRERV